MIIVDTVVGYGWMGVVIFLSAYQEKLDRWNGADTSVVKTLNTHMKMKRQHGRRPMEFKDLITMVSIGMLAGFLSLKLGQWLPDVGKVLTSFGWTIIIVTALGITLSFTRLSELENAGASHIGNVFLYLLHFYILMHAFVLYHIFYIWLYVCMISVFSHFICF